MGNVSSRSRLPGRRPTGACATTSFSVACAPSQKLRLEALKDAYGISISTLRELLNRLTSEGLVVAENARGFEVAPVSADNFRELANLRLLLESHALQRSFVLGDMDWEGRVVAAHHKLATMERRTLAGDKRGLEVLKRYDSEFHQALLSACGSRVLLDAHAAVFDKYVRYLMIAVIFRDAAPPEHQKTARMRAETRCKNCAGDTLDAHHGLRHLHPRQCAGQFARNPSSDQQAPPAGRSRSRDRLRIALETIRLGLIGDNIAASRAPDLHHAAARICGIDVKYERLVPRDLGLTFDDVVERAKQDGFRGLNITYPYKEQVLRFVTIEDPVVRTIGACNTVLFGAPAIGFNTDYTGYVSAFRAQFGARPPGAVAMAGSGGVGKAVAFGLAKLGAKSLALVRHRRRQVTQPRSRASAASRRNVCPSRCVAR